MQVFMLEKFANNYYALLLYVCGCTVQAILKGNHVIKLVLSHCAHRHMHVCVIDVGVSVCKLALSLLLWLSLHSRTSLNGGPNTCLCR
jgi:hypothetical protein